jgi:hypothetical protein
MCSHEHIRGVAFRLCAVRHTHEIVSAMRRMVTARSVRACAICRGGLSGSVAGRAPACVIDSSGSRAESVGR